MLHKLKYARFVYMLGHTVYTLHQIGMELVDDDNGRPRKANDEINKDPFHVENGIKEISWLLSVRIALVHNDLYLPDVSVKVNAPAISPLFT